MKPHIAQTVADLEAEALRLADMIATMKRYGAESASDPAAPVPQATVTPRGESPNPVAVSHPRERRRVSSPKRQKQPEADPEDESATEPSSVTELVRAAIGRLPEPFARVEVIHWIETHYPEKMAEIKPAAVDGVLFRFRKSGELIESGERPGLTGPLILHKRP